MINFFSHSVLNGLTANIRFGKPSLWQQNALVTFIHQSIVMCDSNKNKFVEKKFSILTSSLPKIGYVYPCKNCCYGSPISEEKPIQSYTDGSFVSYFIITNTSVHISKSTRYTIHTHTPFFQYKLKYGFLNDYYEYGIVKNTINIYSGMLGFPSTMQVGNMKQNFHLLNHFENENRFS